ncbi:uncharacterized protein TNCV_702861 [Trichonephila clavipes]|nr:uncharacterized protein TNCV_702861 [Trichonephila clavipes]
MTTVAEWYRYRTVACPVTSSSPVPLKTRHVGQRCTLNLSTAGTSSRWCGVVVRRGGASSVYANNYKSVKAACNSSCQVIFLGLVWQFIKTIIKQKRRFVEWAQNEIAVVPDFHKRILFSDEAHFWLNGFVNKQNCRIWSEANPQVYVETPLHPEKLSSLVYADKPQTLDHLEDNIRRVIADIRLQMLEKVIENWTSRLDYIRAYRGHAMPEIIFKMQCHKIIFRIKKIMSIE